MKNWSGFLTWTPAQILTPSSEEEIQKIVLLALEQKKNIRMIGSSHSFMPLSDTQDILISLNNYQGLITVDPVTQKATVKAGTKLFLLNDLLFEHGLAITNMGDINQQSIAGAISTGTHGTGIEFGNMSTQITAIKFINGLGEIVFCSQKKNPSLFKAAQISLGALGIIVEITLQCVPTYKLEMVIDKAPLEDVLNNYKEINQANRNFEFYWFPNTAYTMTKKVNLTGDTPDKSSMKTYIQDVILENYAFKLLCETSNLFPGLSNGISKLAASTTSYLRKVNHSHKIFATPRLVKFNEMEYNVPVEAYPSVKKDIVTWVNKNNRNVMFPIENRFAKGDDIYLSPAYQRDSAYIAVHVYHKKNFKPYFDALEEIFLAHEGRPHWGKQNSLNLKTLQKRYPEMETFRALRKEQDPEGVFLSPYLRSLFL